MGIGAGLGLIKGFAWGTLTGRISASYLPGDGTFELGEMDGVPQTHVREMALGAFGRGGAGRVGRDFEIQWHFKPNGARETERRHRLTAKAPDHAPEVGVVFSF